MYISDITFITGNQRKADYLAQYLGFPVKHQKIELQELQLLDLREITRHKLLQAYAQVGTPVLVEDTSLTFEALGKLPGPFIKFFISELSLEGLCRLLDGKSRSATTACVYGYYDGKEEAYFEGSLTGTIAEHPKGHEGYGFDSIFIPEGYAVTRAEMDEEDEKATYLKVKRLDLVKEFLVAKK